MISQVKRNNLGQFEPGQSGNPAGRPRKRTPERVQASEAIQAARLAESRAFTSDIDVTIIDVGSDMVSKEGNIIRRVPETGTDTPVDAPESAENAPSCVVASDRTLTPPDAESDRTGQIRYDWTPVGSPRGKRRGEGTYHTIDRRRGIIYELQRVQGWG